MPVLYPFSPSRRLCYLFKHDGHVRELFVTYTLALRAEIEQAVACYASHSVQQRICRSLLALQDRAEGRDLPFTHEFLAQILGASRKSVTVALEDLDANCIIRNTRGKIAIVDRKRLERTACECYAALKSHL